MFIIITCSLVALLLIGVFGVLIYELIKLNVKHIRLGGYDEELKEELSKLNKKKKSTKIISLVFSIIFTTLLVFALAFSLVLKAQENAVVDGPTLKVVYSESMATKNEKNRYLFTNNLNNQFNKFDLITIDKLPAEEDLKLYDIVVYKVEDSLVVHRIIAINTRDVDGETKTTYTLRGDANEKSDSKAITYDEMVGIYTGKRIAFVGSIIVFMQSPAGWIVFAVIVMYMVADEIMKKKLLAEAQKRFAIITKPNNKDAENDIQKTSVEKTQNENNNESKE